MKNNFNCSVTLTSQLKETDLDSFLHIDDEVIDSIEMEMKMRLVELQKRYREKQKELLKLKPKKDRERNKEEEKGKESESLVDYFQNVLCWHLHLNPSEYQWEYSIDPHVSKSRNTINDLS